MHQHLLLKKYTHGNENIAHTSILKTYTQEKDNQLMASKRRFYYSHTDTHTYTPPPSTNTHTH